MAETERFEHITADADILLKVCGVTKVFGPVVALNNVDLTLRKGDVLGLIGENGSGKSTITSIVAGMQKATKSEGIFYKGKEWKSYETKLAYKFYVSQKYKFYMVDIIKEAIYLAYPWMKEFEFDCYSYEYNTKNYEFYLTCDNGKSMYVPMSTLTEHNPKIAEERTVTYYNEYYRWPGGWGKSVTEADVMKWRKENTTDLIESETWKKFCDYLTK